MKRQLQFAVLVGIGCWMCIAGPRDAWQSASSAVKAALIGILPELALVAVGALPQIVIGIHGNPYPETSGPALLHTRGPVQQPLYGVEALLVLANSNYRLRLTGRYARR